MKDGFIKAAAVTPVVHVADPAANAEEIIGGIREALAEEAKIIGVNMAEKVIHSTNIIGRIIFLIISFTQHKEELRIHPNLQDV